MAPLFLNYPRGVKHSQEDKLKIAKIQANQHPLIHLQTDLQLTSQNSIHPQTSSTTL